MGHRKRKSTGYGNNSLLIDSSDKLKSVNLKPRETKDLTVEIVFYYSEPSNIRKYNVSPDDIIVGMLQPLCSNYIGNIHIVGDLGDSDSWECLIHPKPTQQQSFSDYYAIHGCYPMITVLNKNSPISNAVVELRSHEFKNVMEDVKSHSKELDFSKFPDFPPMPTGSAEFNAVSQQIKESFEMLRSFLEKKQARDVAMNEEIRVWKLELDAKNKEIRGWKLGSDAKNKELDAENKELDAKNKELDAKNKELDAKNKELDAKNEEIRGWSLELKETKEIFLKGQQKVASIRVYAAIEIYLRDTLSIDLLKSNSVGDCCFNDILRHDFRGILEEKRSLLSLEDLDGLKKKIWGNRKKIAYSLPDEDDYLESLLCLGVTGNFKSKLEQVGDLLYK